MSQKITARFYVMEITDFGNSDQMRVKLQPAYADGQNKDWAAYTPSGMIELNVGANTAAASFFRGMLRDKENNVAVEFSMVDRGQ